MALTKAMKTVSDKLLLGRCLPCIHECASKIQVPTLELDEYLLTHFKKESIFYAHDPRKLCKTGDIVLIKKLPVPMTKLVTHEVLEILYPLGDITDPVTGKKCVESKTREDYEMEAEILGKVESAFQYNEAPPRGWQEGKKDFTDKEVYIKYHKFQQDEEEYNDPYSV